MAIVSVSQGKVQVNSSFISIIVIIIIRNKFYHRIYYGMIFVVGVKHQIVIQIHYYQIQQQLLKKDVKIVE